MVHEWALAEAIVNSVIEVAKEEKAKKVRSVCIVLGELQSVDRDILEYALNELKKNTIMEDAEIIFENEKAEFKCLKCGFIWQLADVENLINNEIREAIHFIPEVVHAYIKCPRCSSLDYEVIKGRGVWIKKINIVKEEDA